MASNITTLAQDNKELLIQVINLLSDLKEDTFKTPLTRLKSGSIGGHVRHILEHYVCLQQADGVVNYDARARDIRLETELDYTKAHTAGLIDWLLNLSADKSLQVRCSTNVLPQADEVSSTLARELVFLHSHATHHMAIIRLLMMEFDFVLPAEFGKASSTLKHEQNVQS